MSQTLCLNMIVKNESNTITRLFDSVVSIIDAYCICDTGSTDNTVEIIENYFTSKNIPGKVVHEPFKNFCHNRNFALSSCVGLTDFVLLLDADMVLCVKNFDKNMLSKYDTFKVLQGNDSFYYQNVRIVRNNGLYSYSGVTHEYINTPPNSKMFDITKDQLFITDIGDGGSKANKFERDILLLTQGINDEPNNERYHFYLANSYYDTGKYEKAIEYYEKRIKFGGWEQEVWYSYYKIGLAYKCLNKMPEALNAWLNGFDYYPERLEGIYEILSHYRYLSKYKLFLVFYKIAQEILDKKYDKNNYLFLHNDVYTSKVYYEYTIVAAYLGIKNINDEIVKVLNNSTDGSLISNLYSNMKFYKDILVPLKKVVLDNTINIPIKNKDRSFYSSSSCIISHPNKSEGEYLLNLRYVNYYITDKGTYLKCSDYIITSNYLLEFDKDFNLLNKKQFDLSFDDRHYIGVEDVRIYNDKYSNDTVFLGTCFRKDHRIGVCSGKYNIGFDSNDTIKQDVLQYQEITPTFSNSDCEKNWTFVDYNGSTHIVYNWDTLHICKINPETNELNTVIQKPMPKIFSRARGSTNGFTYNKTTPINDDGNIFITTDETEIWFVVHIVSYENPRCYYHMIVVFDENLDLLRYSAPFKFEGEPIEYCLGIVVEDDRVLLSYSAWDRTSRIGVYDKKYIDSIVKYKHET